MLIYAELTPGPCQSFDDDYALMPRMTCVSGPMSQFIESFQIVLLLVEGRVFYRHRFLEARVKLEPGDDIFNDLCKICKNICSSHYTFTEQSTMRTSQRPSNISV